MKNLFHFQDTYYPFTYIDHVRITVRAVVVNDKNEVALIHVVTDDKFGHRDCYELPGGGKKKDESFHEGALREVQEETGFKGKIIKFLAKVDDFYNLIHRNNHNYYYLIKAEEFVGTHMEEYEKNVFDKVLFVNIDKAIELMKGVDDDGVGHLVKQRELPILKLAKEYYMNILLTNDDGYNSKGILLLQKLLSKYGTVVIVAPDSHRSGASASLTITEPLQLVKVKDSVYKCSGTPVDCVSMGLCCFNIKFDLVVSGCNDSWNISYDTMYSGTVGAAQESLIFGVPSIAVSAHSGNDFVEVEQYFDDVWEYIHKNDLLGKEHLLNINFPLGKVEKIALGNLYYRKDENYFTKTQDGYLAFRHLQTDFSDDKDSDCYQVERGIISIVPLSRTYFDKGTLNRLKENIKD